MIVSSVFPGDMNEPLMLIQHDLYWSLIGFLYTCAKQRYLEAIHLTGVETELSRRIKDKPSFDHRVLQDAHDTIAAYFRFAHDDGGQMPLFSEGRTYEENLRKTWSEFWYTEVRRLVSFDPIVIAILTATAYENSDPGYAAETHLRQLLREQYGNFATGAQGQDETPYERE